MASLTHHRGGWDFRRWVRGLLPSIGIGAFLAVLFGVEREHFDWIRTPPAGALIGVFCHTFVWVLGSVFGARLRAMPRTSGLFLRGVMYVVGGTLGFAVGLTISLMTIWRLSLRTIIREIDFGPMLMISAAVALVLGLAIYSYSELKNRLEQSIARLKEHEFAEKELELARSIQSRLLPPAESEGEGYRVAARNLAARYVAGDFYDVFHLGDGSLGLAVADVSGKGMGASLIMASVKAILPILADGKAVEQTLTELNGKLARELGKREFVALAIARFEPSTGRLQLANAGLPDPFLLRHGCEPVAVGPPGPRLPLGIRQTVSYQAAEIRLEPGDRFLMFSDGIPEAPTPRGEPLGYDALGLLLSDDRPKRPAGEWLDALFRGVRAQTTETLEDDWTALVLERTG